MTHGPGTLLLLAALSAATAAYLAAAATRPWPAHRTALWCAGAATAAAALAGPLATAAHTGFVAHTAAHLLLGMLAPVLLVLSAPVTLALRALPVEHARRLSRALRTPPARALAHPVTAALLSVGGAWVLYTTGLHAATMHDPALRALVQAHLLASGYLLAAALVGVDPAPHRPSRPVRAAVLLLAAAAHAVLAKHLYANPPDGVPADQAEAGAQLMYYGGDAVELLLAVVLAAQWYRATRPAPALAR